MTRVVRGYRLLVSAFVLVAFNVAMIGAFAAAGSGSDTAILATWFVGDALITLVALGFLDHGP